MKTDKPAPKPKRLVEIRLVVETKSDVSLADLRALDTVLRDVPAGMYFSREDDINNPHDGRIVRVTAKRIARKP